MPSANLGGVVVASLRFVASCVRFAMGNVLDCASPIELPDDFGDETTECQLAATRLSRSMLWTLNRAFYVQHGAASWASGAVPSFMTTNAYIAKAYSRYVLGVVLDVWRENSIGNMEEPLYIVEVGGGSGRLSYLILEALLRFERFLPVGPDGRLQIRYVVTDASQSIVDAWKKHPLMKTLCDEAEGLGLLDYGVFNAEKDNEIKMQISGKRIATGEQSNPVIFIGNYVADSLCHDALRMPSSGGVQLAQLGITAQRGLGKTLNALQRHESGSGVPTDAPAAATDAMHDEEALLQAAEREEAALSFLDVTPEWSYEEKQDSEEVFPGHPVWDAIVRRYRRTLSSGCVMMPVGALTMLEAAQRMTGGNALVLLGDKGCTQPWEMGVLAETGEGNAGAEGADPHVAQHGSVSMLVNFDAISQWAAAQGAVYASTDQIVGFKVATVVMSAAHGTLSVPRAEDEAAAPGGVGPAAAAAQDALLAPPAGFDAGVLRRAFMHTLFHFKHAIQLFSPEDFATLQRNVKQEVPNPTLRLLLALLRLGAHDGEVFMKFKAQFISRAAELRRDDPLAADVIAQDVPALQTAFFPLTPERDLHFELGRVCMGLGAHDSALDLFKQSNVSAGEHHVTWHNIGLCHWFLGKTQAAIEGFNSSLALQGDYVEAGKWLAKAEERLALEQGGAVSEHDVPVELEDSE